MQSWASVVFITITVRIRSLFLTTCFFGGMMVHSDITVFIIAHINLCKISRSSANVFIYRCWPAPVPYVTTQENIIKNLPVPWWLSNSPVMTLCKSLKLYNVSFICDHSRRKFNLIYYFMYLLKLTSVHQIKTI